MYSEYDVKTGKHILYKNSAFTIVIYERAMCPSIVFNCSIRDFDFDNASIMGRTFRYRGVWAKTTTEERYIDAAQINNALGVNVFEDWMYEYYQGVLISNKMRGITGMR